MADILDNLTLVLRRPVTYAKQEFTEITLTEPTVDQLVKADEQPRPMAQAATLIALNAKVPPGVVALLSQRDFQDAMDFFNRFGATSPPTSAT